MAYLSETIRMQRPEDQRRNAHDDFRRERSAGFGGLLERIERTGADIAVDNAKRGESRGGWQPRGMVLRQPRCPKGLGHSYVLAAVAPV